MIKKVLLIGFLILSFFLTSCENEPIGGMDINTDTIAVASDTFHSLSRTPGDTADDPLSCIRFNYAFVLYIFDANETFLEAVGITSDAVFSEVLGNLEEEQSISISYPISGTTVAGDLIEVRNNDELKSILDSCLLEEVKNDCETSLTEASCVWNVTDPSFINNPYNGAHFKAKMDGTIQFYYRDGVYFGNWTTLFIGNDLYLNIFISGDDAIAAYWNVNWKVDFFSEETMTLSAGDASIELSKNCVLPCSEEIFTSCETEETPGIGKFILQDRTICYPVNAISNSLLPVHFSFHESQVDAETDSNPIDSTSYFNTINPQVLYVRIEVAATQETLRIETLEIKAIPCD